MPPLSELPGNLPRQKLLRALEHLGFVVDKSGGAGSHCKITYTRTQKSLTVPYETLPKLVLKYVLKEIEQYSGVTWDEIKKEL